MSAAVTKVPDFAPALERPSVEMRLVVTMAALLPVGPGGYRAKWRKSMLDLRSMAVQEPRTAALIAVCAWPFWAMPLLGFAVAEGLLHAAWPVVPALGRLNDVLFHVVGAGVCVAIARLSFPLRRVRVFSARWDIAIVVAAVVLVVSALIG